MKRALILVGLIGRFVSAGSVFLLLWNPCWGCQNHPIHKPQALFLRGIELNELFTLTIIFLLGNNFKSKVVLSSEGWDSYPKIHDLNQWAGFGVDTAHNR